MSAFDIDEDHHDDDHHPAIDQACDDAWPSRIQVAYSCVCECDRDCIPFAVHRAATATLVRYLTGEIDA